MKVNQELLGLYTRIHLATIQVERITGLDFFSQLPDDVENEIESNYNLNQWR